MKAAEILAHVDHTLLKQTATWADIQRICDEAVTYHTATVMVPSAYVPRIVAKYGDALKVATVVGFPNGNCNTAAKIAETAQALADGAEEIDMVMNIGAAKAGDWAAVQTDIAAVVLAANPAIVKVIIETCMLADEEKVKACLAAKAAGAAFVKTSTGFSTGGATPEDIALMRKTVDSALGVKASGGVRTREQALQMIEAGASRIGCSSTKKIME